MCFFTIFTPTYNRAYTLSILYNSLKNQTCKDFEWLIVDDGSTDNTCELVREYIKEEKKFPINYYKKENGGKPRAINYGIKLAKGKYFLMIDSDDYLVDNAVANMKNWCKEIDKDERFVGVGAARGYEKNVYIKGVEPLVNENGYIDATNLQRERYNLDADMTEAYKTNIFKKYPMAEWSGENLLPESCRGCGQVSRYSTGLFGYGACQKK